MVKRLTEIINIPYAPLSSPINSKGLDCEKLINDPFEVVDEMFTGFVAANDRIVKAVGKRSIARVQSQFLARLE